MNIYVGNLAYEVTDDDLNEAFSPFGEVTSARVIRDRFTDRSRGFGFVEMSNDTEAQTAICNGFCWSTVWTRRSTIRSRCTFSPRQRISATRRVTSRTARQR